MKLDAARQRIEIDANKACDIGIRFCGERNARQLSVQDVADKLLFSKQQVLGLETGDLKSFYGVKLFLQAADKYAALLEIADKPSVLLVAGDAAVEALSAPLAVQETEIPTGAPTEAPAKAGTESKPNEPPATEPIDLPVAITERTSNHSKPLLFAATAVAVGVAGYLMLNQSEKSIQAVPAAIAPIQAKAEPQPQPDSTTPPAAPASASSPTPATTTATPAVTNVTTPQSAAPAPTVTTAPTASAVKAGQIQIKFNASSWVQTVEVNGIKQEKIYQKGETLDLEPAKLQALIIGNAKAATLSNVDGQVSLVSYVASGSQVARIVGPNIRNLSKIGQP